MSNMIYDDGSEVPDQPSSAASEPISAEQLKSELWDLAACGGHTNRYGDEYTWDRSCLRCCTRAKSIETYASHATAELRRQERMAVGSVRNATITIREFAEEIEELRQQLAATLQVGDELRKQLRESERELAALKASIPEKAQHAAEEIADGVDGYAQLAHASLPSIDRSHIAAIITRIFRESHG